MMRLLRTTSGFETSSRASALAWSSRTTLSTRKAPVFLSWSMTGRADLSMRFGVYRAVPKRLRLWSLRTALTRSVGLRTT